MSDLVKQTLENKLTQMRTASEGILRGIQATEQDLAEQKHRFDAMEKQINEFEKFLNSTTFGEN